MIEKIGILHPGLMGISVAASARNNGHQVFWASERRSAATRDRAESQDLVELETLAALCKTCSLIISVCPPHAAEKVALQVVANSFRGLFVDANAIAPQKAVRIGELMVSKGIDFVDGGIIGGPAWQPGTTCLYLSGIDAGRVAACFFQSPLEVAVIGEEVGKASALKMCYAAYTKGSTALICAILAAAEALDVRLELEMQWGGDFSEQNHTRTRNVTSRAWRFTGEMEEIAATFEGVGMPGGFHQAAAQIYQRIAHFKSLDNPPALEQVLDALLVSKSLSL
jgi:3-hydroxyisobutyrate dehydrogenase-like beta-hydroxyacid dehydrogenase